MTRMRLDQALVERGLAPSRARAQSLILAGVVRVGGEVADKAGRAVDASVAITVDAPDYPWVSRGGIKLAAALDAFAIDPGGLRCLDVGASTGGFTHVLLTRGAESVVALDVGRGQLDWSLRQDPRVTVLEGVNARFLTPADLPGPFDLITVDVSFISLRLVLPALQPLLGAAGRLVALIKPQFEAGRGQVGRGGVVRDAAVREAAIAGVLVAADALGLRLLGRIASPIPGPAGNVEELAGFASGSRDQRIS
ncbi:MAG: TlyA family RNA methyltransferase [Thermoanaerobaculaceae bacterium]|jgi:23S rRNA (cytidine1920-2'-O)/16S rRNA (cytidine1409-2'-O)-methyltransferase|nr:TlyA family RNA methyltransferase [Thermoanaerobaculaceae bacterium]